MFSIAPAKLRSSLVLASAVALVCVLAGCGGDDENPMNGGNGDDEFTGQRNTIALLLTDWFEKAYSQQRGDEYAQALDADFEFVFLEADRDSFGIPELTRANDIASTNAMFAHGQVSAVSLNVNPRPSAPYTGDDCDGCFEVGATVNVLVTTNPPGATEPEVLTVNSDQTFVVKPDPDSAGVFVLFRQTDGDPLTGGKRPDVGSEIQSVVELSWGKVKHLYLPSR
jgi:hypothetical protein